MFFKKKIMFLILIFNFVIQVGYLYAAQLILFAKPGCSHCLSVEKHMQELKEEYPILKVEKMNPAISDNIDRALEICLKYNVPDEKQLVAPSVFVGNRYFVYPDINYDEIKQVLNADFKRDKKDGLVSENWSDTSGIIKQKFSSYALIPVFLAGLVDGINPCAFAVLVFFLSYLKIAGRSKLQLISTGMIFSFFIFITYFLIGLGFFHSLRFVFSYYSWIIKAFYFVTGVVAVILGVISFRDARLIKKGKAKEIKLQLSEKNKARTRKLIRTNIKLPFIFAGTALTAVGIAFLELGCTGQVYVPVISYIMQNTTFNFKAYILLFAYNFAFIVPLLVIFSLFIIGTTYDKILGFLTGNLIRIKLIMGITFFILGGYILLSLLDRSFF